MVGLRLHGTWRQRRSKTHCGGEAAQHPDGTTSMPTNGHSWKEAPLTGHPTATFSAQQIHMKEYVFFQQVLLSNN